MIDEGARRNVAGSATERGVMWERALEEGFAAFFCVAEWAHKLAARAEPAVGQEIDVLDISDQRVQHRRRRLRAGEFIDDHATNEVAQRRAAAVMAVRLKIARAAQARGRDSIVDAVVCE